MAISLILILFIVSINCYAHNPEWINYTNGDQVNALAIQGDYIWAGISGELVKINRYSGETKFYNKANFELPNNYVRSIFINNDSV